MSQLNGRVFSRLHQYEALPKDHQSEVERLEAYLSSIQTEIFDSHRTLSLKSIYGARARHLLEKIEAWSKTNGHIGASTHASTGTTEQPDKPKFLKNYEAATGGAPSSMMPPGTDHVGGHHSAHAKQLLDALVLKGFLTPKKEKKPDDVAIAEQDDLEFKESDLLVAVGKNLTMPKGSTSKPTTVWDLVDGAVFAGMVKRKANLIEKLAHGKDVYVLVNDRHKNVTIFSTDLSRKPLLQLKASTLKVALDASHFQHGVKLWNESDNELVSAASPHVSDALMHALVAIGVSQDTLQATPHTDKIHREVKDEIDAGGKHSHTHGMTGTTKHEHGATTTSRGAHGVHGSSDTHHPVEAVKDKMTPSHDHGINQGMDDAKYDKSHSTRDHAVAGGAGLAMGEGMHHAKHDQTQTTRDHGVNRTTGEALKDKLTPDHDRTTTHDHGVNRTTGEALKDKLTPDHDRTTTHDHGINRTTGEGIAMGEGMHHAKHDQTHTTRDHGVNRTTGEALKDKLTPDHDRTTTHDHGINRTTGEGIAMGEGMHHAKHDQTHTTRDHGVNRTTGEALKDKLTPDHDRTTTHDHGINRTTGEGIAMGEGMHHAKHDQTHTTRDHGVNQGMYGTTNMSPKSHHPVEALKDKLTPDHDRTTTHDHGINRTTGEGIAMGEGMHHAKHDQTHTTRDHGVNQGMYGTTNMSPKSHHPVEALKDKLTPDHDRTTTHDHGINRTTGEGIAMGEGMHHAKHDQTHTTRDHGVNQGMYGTTNMSPKSHHPVEALKDKLTPDHDRTTTHDHGINRTTGEGIAMGEGMHHAKHDQTHTTRDHGVNQGMYGTTNMSPKSHHPVEALKDKLTPDHDRTTTHDHGINRTTGEGIAMGEGMHHAKHDQTHTTRDHGVNQGMYGTTNMSPKSHHPVEALKDKLTPDHDRTTTHDHGINRTTGEGIAMGEGMHHAKHDQTHTTRDHGVNRTTGEALKDKLTPDHDRTTTHDYGINQGMTHGEQGTYGATDTTSQTNHPVEALKDKLTPDHDRTTTHDHGVNRTTGEALKDKLTPDSDRTTTHDHGINQGMTHGQQGTTQLTGDHGVNRTNDHINKEHEDESILGKIGRFFAPDDDHTTTHDDSINRTTGEGIAMGEGMHHAKHDQTHTTRDHGVNQGMYGTTNMSPKSHHPVEALKDQITPDHDRTTTHDHGVNSTNDHINKDHEDESILGKIGRFFAPDDDHTTTPGDGINQGMTHGEQGTYGATDTTSQTNHPVEALKDKLTPDHDRTTTHDHGVNRTTGEALKDKLTPDSDRTTTHDHGVNQGMYGATDTTSQTNHPVEALKDKLTPDHDHTTTHDHGVNRTTGEALKDKLTPDSDRTTTHDHGINQGMTHAQQGTTHLSGDRVMNPTNEHIRTPEYTAQDPHTSADAHHPVETLKNEVDKMKPTREHGLDNVQYDTTTRTQDHALNPLKDHKNTANQEEGLKNEKLYQSTDASHVKHTDADPVPSTTTENESLLGKIGRFFSPDEHDKTPPSSQQKDHATTTTSAP